MSEAISALTFKGQLEGAITAFEQAIVLNPNFTDWRFALPLVFSGQFTRAIEVAQNAHYMLKQYSATLTLERACLARSPNHRAARSVLAASYAQLGRIDEARAEAREILRIEPTYTINGTQRQLSAFKFQEHADHYFSGLRKAGLPTS